MKEKEHIFSENAPQFSELPEYYTAENVTRMRENFKEQKITVDDLEKSMTKDPLYLLDFEYDKDNWLKSTQWTVDGFDEKIDCVMLKFYGSAG